MQRECDHADCTRAASVVLAFQPRPGESFRMAVPPAGYCRAHAADVAQLFYVVDAGPVASARWFAPPPEPPAPPSRPQCVAIGRKTRERCRRRAVKGDPDCLCPTHRQREERTRHANAA